MCGGVRAVDPPRDVPLHCSAQHPQLAVLSPVKLPLHLPRTRLARVTPCYSASPAPVFGLENGSSLGRENWQILQAWKDGIPLPLFPGHGLETGGFSSNSDFHLIQETNLSSLCQPSPHRGSPFGARGSPRADWGRHHLQPEGIGKGLLEGLRIAWQQCSPLPQLPRLEAVQLRQGPCCQARAHPPWPPGP